jgi:hypothetical protein
MRPIVMLNKDTFQTNPADYRLANQGVAKISFPPTSEALETLRGELSTFVCDGAYANGLSRILEAYLGSVGKGGSAPAVWISGQPKSGRSVHGAWNHAAVALVFLVMDRRRKTAAPKWNRCKKMAA